MTERNRQQLGTATVIATLSFMLLMVLIAG
jgi:hypothetical protein